MCPQMPRPGVWTQAPEQVELDAQARADIEKLFAVRDADYNRCVASGFQKTQTLPLPTQPASLR